jgi:hypothetical protein
MPARRLLLIRCWSLVHAQAVPECMAELGYAARPHVTQHGQLPGLYHVMVT